MQCHFPAEKYKYNQIQFDMEISDQNDTPNLTKLISFLTYHQVLANQIWGSDPCLSVIMFADVLQQKFGYKVSTDELVELTKLADKMEKLYVQSFHVFGLWKSCVYQEKQRKPKNFRKQKQRPLTAKQLGSNLCNSKSSVFNNSQKSHLCVQSVLKSRIKQTDETLEKKIIENALDKKWEYLIKVGQMNSWKKQTKMTEKSSNDQEPEAKQSKPLNKIYKVQGHQQNIVIIQQKQNGEAEILPLKVFDQKYQSMKKKLTTQEKVKNNMKGSMLLVLQKKDKVTKSKLCQRISQRDQELNYVLLQIMRLKNLFEQQEHVLSECGVNM